MAPEVRAGLTTVGPAIIDEAGLQTLLAELETAGYLVLGPVVDDGVIMRGPITALADLPQGWRDDQQPGRYRLEKTDDPRYFAFAVGPESPRRDLNPANELLWTANRRDDGAVSVSLPSQSPDKVALFGVRSCDVHARKILDRVMIGGAHPDTAYARRRSDQVAIAVECAESAATCFCVSMKTGPQVETSAVDLALTEIVDEHGHRFLVKAGSEFGQELLARIPHRAATPTEVDHRADIVAGAAEQQRSIVTKGLPERFEAMMEHPRWDDVAERCVSCGNCTMVCPTCFCHSEQDTTSFDGAHTEHSRQWDSCFSADHSYVHGGSVRSTTRSRYRQWLTHKLGTWHEQFGTSGCVGCGRCITWCPPGIDITAEVSAIWEDPQ